MQKIVIFLLCITSALFTACTLDYFAPFQPGTGKAPDVAGLWSTQVQVQSPIPMAMQFVLDVEQDGYALSGVLEFEGMLMDVRGVFSKKREVYLFGQERGGAGTAEFFGDFNTLYTRIEGTMRASVFGLLHQGVWHALKR